MRAAVRDRYGPPDVVRLAEVPRPSPAAGQLLVRVRATTVNRTDCAYRSGTPAVMRFFSGLRKPNTSILGTEFAGVVDEVGGGVDGFRAGDRICGWCENSLGAHAEFLTLDARSLIARIPADRTYAQAAPSMEGSHYALALLRLAKVQAGDRVLIYGASGTIGSAAVQLSRSLGADVTAVCGTESIARVAGLGPDRVVDYQREDFTRGEQRYDLVFDAVGKTSYATCRHMLEPDGLFSASEGWGTIFRAVFGPLVRDRRVVFPFPRRDAEGIRWLTGLVESGEFEPLIERIYPFEQIVDAYRRAETGEKVGSLVIDVDRADELT